MSTGGGPGGSRRGPEAGEAVPAVPGPGEGARGAEGAVPPPLPRSPRSAAGREGRPLAVRAALPGSAVPEAPPCLPAPLGLGAPSFPLIK